MKPKYNSKQIKKEMTNGTKNVFNKNTVKFNRINLVNTITDKKINAPRLINIHGKPIAMIP